MKESQKTTQQYNTLPIPPREGFHKHFGGRIYPSDFNNDYRGNDNIYGSTIASRIEADRIWESKLEKEGWFENLCKQNRV